MSPNYYSAKLSPWQTRTFLLFIILMLADVTITIWGFLNWSGFIEGNPLYAKFSGMPSMFINTILWVKLAAIAGILLVVQWFNEREPTNTPLHGGNIVCGSATVGMGILLSILLSMNLLMIV